LGALLFKRTTDFQLGRIQSERSKCPRFRADLQVSREKLKAISAPIFVEPLLLERLRPCQYRFQLLRRDFGQTH